MRHLLLLATFLLLPGTYWVQRLTNGWGVLIYLILGGMGIYGVVRLSRQWREVTSERFAVGVAAVVLALLVGSFWVVYPRINCQVPGCGSDRDDALNLAADALLAGRYPYDARTYHGNPITPLPGAILLALPFRLMGNTAYQTFFWLAALFWLTQHLRDDAHFAAIICGLLLTSPAVLHEIWSGGDLLANALYVTVLSVLMVLSISAENTPTVYKIGVALLFGLSLSSRPNFLLVAPLVVAAIAQRSGWQRAVGYGLLSGATTVGVTLPFFLSNPTNFAPLQRTGELADIDLIVPYLGTLIVPLLMVVLTGVLCLPRFQHGTTSLLLSSALVQLAPIAIGTAALSLNSHAVDLQLMSFGTIFIVSGTVAALLTIMPISSSG